MQNWNAVALHPKQIQLHPKKQVGEQLYGKPDAQTYYSEQDIT
jgi:hypothetical protein